MLLAVAAGRWGLVAVAAALSVLLAYELALRLTGRLTVDTGWGRVLVPLGPQVVRIAAPRDLVFHLIALPYLSPDPPRRLREKVQVLERGKNMVLAAHRTRVGFFTSTTVETVTFQRPERVSFRLVRGPVPYAAEEFRLLTGAPAPISSTRASWAPTSGSSAA